MEREDAVDQPGALVGGSGGLPGDATAGIGLFGYSSTRVLGMRHSAENNITVDTVERRTNKHAFCSLSFNPLLYCIISSDLDPLPTLQF
jgi:hypothetical protein